MARSKLRKEYVGMMALKISDECHEALKKISEEKNISMKGIVECLVIILEGNARLGSVELNWEKCKFARPSKKDRWVELQQSFQEVWFFLKNTKNKRVYLKDFPTTEIVTILKWFYAAGLIINKEKGIKIRIFNVSIMDINIEKCIPRKGNNDLKGVLKVMKLPQKEVKWAVKEQEKRNKKIRQN